MSNEVERRPLLRGIVRGTLLHDNNEYAHGSEFVTSDQALFDELRRLGAVKLPHEVAEAAQTLLADRDAELEMLRQQVAELQARAQAQPEAKSAKGKPATESAE